MGNSFLTVKEAADRLRVSERSILRYIHGGHLRASKIGYWRITESDINSFLRTNANKKTRPLRILSLFSGCGGMDLGFVQEGFEIVWANDNNKWACDTYRKNLGDHITEDDIAFVDIKKLPDCEVILGGFPCQDFSMIWKRGGINTDRGNLYKYFVDIVAN
jgi:excisionase family DNA binding protein